MQLVCDASPWGIGAVLLRDGIPIRKIFDAFCALDHLVMGTREGDPSGQAAFEALAVLVAARTWLPEWRNVPMTIVIQSDSLAALGAAAKVGSTVASMNSVMRELSLDLAEANYQVGLFGHIPGRLNDWADKLSRIYQPGVITDLPQELMDVPLTDLPRRNVSWWRAAPPSSSSSRRA